MESNRKDKFVFKQPQSMEERRTLAQLLPERLKYRMRVALDPIERPGREGLLGLAGADLRDRQGRPDRVQGGARTLRLQARGGREGPLTPGAPKLMSRSRRFLEMNAGVALTVALTACAVATATGQTDRGPDVVALDVSRPGAPIPPTLFGVFFEDINFAADGGLYPERVKNRSFEFTEPLQRLAQAVAPGGRRRAGRPRGRRPQREQPALPPPARSTAPGSRSASSTRASAAWASRPAPSTSSPRTSARTRAARGRCRCGCRTTGSSLWPRPRSPGSAQSGSGTRRRCDRHDARPRAARDRGRRGGRDRRRHGVALSRGRPGRTGRTGCGRTWCSCSPT